MGREREAEGGLLGKQPDEAEFCGLKREGANSVKFYRAVEKNKLSQRKNSFGN